MDKTLYWEMACHYALRLSSGLQHKHTEASAAFLGHSVM